MQHDFLDLPQILARWKEKLGPRSDAWTNRLGWDGLSELDLSHALGIAPFSETNLPAWASEMERFILFATDNPDFLGSTQSPDEPFAELWKYCRHFGSSRLRDLLHSTYGDLDAILMEQAWESLLDGLIKRLQDVSLTLLYSEFDNARPFGLRSVVTLLSKTEIGIGVIPSSSSKLYKEFVDEILLSGFHNIFRTYPVLGRLFGEILLQWEESVSEFLIRLMTDWQSISKKFCLAKEEKVRQFRLQLSDHHQQGKTVIHVQFSETAIVYKPRNIELERDFNDFLEVVNSFIDLPFKVNTVLCCGDYGWARFVESKSCDDTAAIGRFYERFGGLLALLHVLRATDCHYENVIACGDNPVLIDLETLMHPEVGWEDESRKILGGESPNRHFFDSVLRVGILPTWQFSGDLALAYDLSSLGYTEVQNLKSERAIWRWCGLDLMHPHLESVLVSRPGNVPHVGNTSIDPGDFVEQIVIGFRKLFDLLIRKRESQAIQHGLSKMYSRPVRFIFRASQVYGTTLRVAAKPDSMTNGIWYGLEFEVLARVFLSCEEKPSIWPLFESEIRQLADLDIPYFVGSNASADLQLSNKVILKRYFERPSFEDVNNKLQLLDDDSLDRQVLLIRGSFLARSGHLKKHQEILIPKKCLSRNSNELLFQQIALNIGEQLASTALWENEKSCTWYGISFVSPAGRYQLKPLGYNLYDGSSGVALFLSALFRTSNNPKYRRLAKAAIYDVRKLLRRPSSSVTKRMAEELGIGAGSGLGSIAYALARIARFLADRSISDDALCACRILREQIAVDRKFDVMSGTAGGLLSALAVYRDTGEADALTIANECGLHLLQVKDVFQSRSSGSWEFDGIHPPVGFAHGASGIAYAACSLDSYIPDRRFRELAQLALAYEDAVLATKDRTLAGNFSWCSGVGGFVFSRLKCSQLLGSDARIQWKNDSISSLLLLDSSDTVGPDHLCCGQFGRIETQKFAGDILGNADFGKAALRRARAVISIQDAQTNFRLHPSIHESSYFPGFFQGKAGIGYALLRLQANDALPHILAFD